MVRVDDVYQRVLALANKEQRGYITPQDFNLFANQAQMEIFEQYFYDTNVARKTQGNDTVYADADDMLEEKMQIFENHDSVAETNSYNTTADGFKILPDNFYRVHEIIRKTKCEILNTKDFNTCVNINTPSLLRPTAIRPVANIRSNIIRVHEGSGFTNTYEVVYFRVPRSVNWTYVVMNKKAMFNANATTQNFELHRSEEVQLVNKILKLAGVSIKQIEIMRAGQIMDQSVTQLQPKI